MLKEFDGKVYLFCGKTDLRRGIDGLVKIIIDNSLKPDSKALYLFCGTRRDRIKGVLWEEDGFLLLYKRIDNGKFIWPRNSNEAKMLSHDQYIWLLQGLEIEQPKAIKKAPKNRDFV